MRATLAGFWAVLLWGLALPFYRLGAERFGTVFFAAALFAGGGIAGLLGNALRGVWVGRAELRHPALYLRWGAFVGHEAMLFAAVILVHPEHLPIVIFMNYLWPTAVILFSVGFAGVRIARWRMFAAGNAVVVAALFAELIGGAELATGDSRDHLAYALAFAGALCWGLYSAISRRWGSETGGGAPVPLFQIAVAVALALAFPALPPAVAPGAIWSAALALYCAVYALGYLGWDLGMRRGNIVVLSLGADFIPFMSLAATSVLIGAAIGGRTVVSTAALVGGAMAVRYATTQR
jgi:drug/metabolite transporter (DMT)-like permease